MIKLSSLCAVDKKTFHYGESFIHETVSEQNNIVLQLCVFSPWLHIVSFLLLLLFCYSKLSFQPYSKIICGKTFLPFPQDKKVVFFQCPQVNAWYFWYSKKWNKMFSSNHFSLVGIGFYGAFRVLFTSRDFFSAVKGQEEPDEQITDGFVICSQLKSCHVL